MNKQEFKVGDRVMAVSNVAVDKDPRPGVIEKLFRSKPFPKNYDYLVRYDEGYCAWSNVEALPKTKHPVIVITSDGKTTTATMREGKKVLKTATATCSEKDTFSFDEGARIAFERLHGRDSFKASKDKPQPTKLVCVDNKIGIAGFVEGKVYEIKWRTDVSFDFVGNAFGGCFFGGEHYAPFYDSKVVFIPLVED